MRLPTYTTDDGVTYLLESFVSLDNSMINDAFISDCSGLGSYDFTVSANELFLNGTGVHVNAVRFSVSIPFPFDKDCFQIRLALCVNFLEVTTELTLLSFLKIEIGAFIGVGLDIGFTFNRSTTSIEFVSKVGALVGIGSNAIFLQKSYCLNN